MAAAIYSPWCGQGSSLACAHAKALRGGQGSGP